MTELDVLRTDWEKAEHLLIRATAQRMPFHLYMVAVRAAEEAWERYYHALCFGFVRPEEMST